MLCLLGLLLVSETTSPLVEGLIRLNTGPQLPSAGFLHHPAEARLRNLCSWGLRTDLPIIDIATLSD